MLVVVVLFRYKLYKCCRYEMWKVAYCGYAFIVNCVVHNNRIGFHIIHKCFEAFKLFIGSL